MKKYTFLLFLSIILLKNSARFGRSGMGPQRMGRGGMGRQWGHPMMMTDEANVGNAEIGNRLATEEFNTIARNWPALEFVEEKPEPTLDPLAAMFAIQALALKELQKNEPQVAAYRRSLPWNERTLRRKYLPRPLRM